MWDITIPTIGGIFIDMDRLVEGEREHFWTRACERFENGGVLDTSLIESTMPKHFDTFRKLVAYVDWYTPDDGPLLTVRGVLTKENVKEFFQWLEMQVTKNSLEDDASDANSNSSKSSDSSSSSSSSSSDSSKSKKKTKKGPKSAKKGKKDKKTKKKSKKTKDKKDDNKDKKKKKKDDRKKRKSFDSEDGGRPRESRGSGHLDESEEDRIWKKSVHELTENDKEYLTAWATDDDGAYDYKSFYLDPFGWIDTHTRTHTHTHTHTQTTTHAHTHTHTYAHNMHTRTHTHTHTHTHTRKRTHTHTHTHAHTYTKRIR